MFKKFFGWIASFFRGLLGDNEMQKFAVETLAMTAGALIARKNPELMKKIEKYHGLLVGGNINVYLLNKVFRDLKDADIDPIIMNRLTRLAAIVGVKFVDSARKEIDDISEVDFDLLDRVVKWFMEGVRSEQ